MAVNSSGIVVLTTSPDSRLVAFDSLGRVLSVIRSGGGGHDSLGPVTQLGAAGQHSVTVADVRSGRVFQMSPAGGIRALFTAMLGDRVQAVASVGANRFLLVLTSNTRHPVMFSDSAGKALDSVAIPWPEYGKLDPLARQAGTSCSESGFHCVVGFIYGDGFFAFDQGRPLPYQGRYIEHTEFPSVVVSRFPDGSSSSELTRVTLSARDIAITDSLVFVLFGGSGPYAGKVVDQYNFADGRYQGSCVTATPALAIAAHGNRLYILTAGVSPIVFRTRSCTHN